MTIAIDIRTTEGRVNRDWYAYVPRHVTSARNRMIGHFRATVEEVQDAFGKSATINVRTGEIHFYKRP